MVPGQTGVAGKGPSTIHSARTMDAVAELAAGHRRSSNSNGRDDALAVAEVSRNCRASKGKQVSGPGLAGFIGVMQDTQYPELLAPVGRQLKLANCGQPCMSGPWTRPARE